MSNYLYEAVDASGLRNEGALDVSDQNEALKRIREMGLFPLKVRQAMMALPKPRRDAGRKQSIWQLQLTAGRVKPATLAVFTRQLATLVDVGMPLLRGLRLLEEQEENRTFKRIIAEIARAIEGGGTLSEALAAHPSVFDRLYVNMVKAGEAGGVLETVLRRQADFMEKALKIKGKVKAAMFYPLAVMTVAAGILTLLMVFIIPRFQEVFKGLLNGRPMPAFTQAVMNISDVFKEHFLSVGLGLAALVIGFKLTVRTAAGRRWFDGFKLAVPVIGKLAKKIALARFARTLGTLLGSGVPILQALAIVKETTGNVVVGGMVGKIHENVKEGGSLAEPVKESGVFPAMIGGMVDVGEQTGALPDMLVKIADTCDEEMDNSVAALTSLLEPAMIIFLAVVVGSIVIAMFLPLLTIMSDPNVTGGQGGAAEN